MDRSEKAVSLFDQGFSCAQAVLASFAGDLGLEEETALRVATAFGAGMAEMGRTCGAVTGAMMVLGLKYGRTVGSDNEARDRNYNKVREFIKRFRAEKESIDCIDLLGVDIGTPEGKARITGEAEFHSRCAEIIRISTRILESLLLSENEPSL